MAKTKTDTTITVERNIPIPPHHVGRKPGCVMQTLQTMKTNESVKVPFNRRNGWFIAAKRIGVKIVTRTTQDGDARIWKVS